MSDVKIEPGWYWATYKLGKPEIVQVTSYAVLCTGTDREYPIEDFVFHAAIAAWNTRAEPAADRLAELERAAQAMLDTFRDITPGVCQCNWHPQTCKFHKATGDVRAALAAYRQSKGGEI